MSIKIVVRSMKLFGRGLFLNNGFDTDNWRIPGVLQVRLSLGVAHGLGGSRTRSRCCAHQFRGNAVSAHVVRAGMRWSR